MSRIKPIGARLARTTLRSQSKRLERAEQDLPAASSDVFAVRSCGNPRTFAYVQKLLLSASRPISRFGWRHGSSVFKKRAYCTEIFTIFWKHLAVSHWGFGVILSQLLEPMIHGHNKCSVCLPLAKSWNKVSVIEPLLIVFLLSIWCSVELFGWSKCNWHQDPSAWSNDVS